MIQSMAFQLMGAVWAFLSVMQKKRNANSDMGSHHFKFASMPHAGALDRRVVRAARGNNAPVRTVIGDVSQRSCIELVGNPSIIPDSVKRGEVKMMKRLTATGKARSKRVWN